MNTEIKAKKVLDIYKEVIPNLEINTGKRKNGKELAEKKAEKPACLRNFYRYFSTVNDVLTNYKFILYSLIINGNTVMTSYYIKGHSTGILRELLSKEAKIVVSGIDLFFFTGDEITGYQDISHKIKTTLVNEMERKDEYLMPVKG